MVRPSEPVPEDGDPLGTTGAAALQARGKAFSTLTACRRIMVQVQVEADLLLRLCQTLVEAGGYRLAWIGRAEHDERQTVRALVSAGSATSYLNEVFISWANTPAGNGPAGTALRTGRPAIVQNNADDPSYSPWRQAALVHGLAASIGLPVRRGGRIWGILSLYTAYHDPFGPIDLDLLQGLADDLGQCLDAYDTRDARDRALQRERELRLLAEQRLGRQQRLQQLTAALAGATDVQQVAQAIVDHGTTLFDASAGWVRALEEGGTTLRVLAIGGQASFVATADIPVSPASVFDDVMRRQRPVLISNSEQLRPSYSDTAERMDMLGIEAAVMVPLLVGSQVAGALGFNFSEPRRFDDEDRAYLDILGGLCGQALDRARLYDTLRTSVEVQARLAAIVTSSDDAIIGKTLDGTITSWNAAAEGLYGYRADAVIGQPITILASPDRPDEIPELLNRVAQGQHIRQFETVRRRRDGRLIDVAINLSPIRDGNGTIVSIATIAHDIGERKQAEALRLRSVALEEENGRILREAKLKTEFFANMSHEFRTPLNAITGFAELLTEGRAGPLSDDHRELIGNILTSARHLVEVVNDVLDLAKIEAGKINFQSERVDIAQIVNEVREVLWPLANAQGLQLTARVARTLGPLETDPMRLKQVLYNYLSNAIKFTPTGGRITVSVSAHGDDAFRIAVRDTGIGIAPEHLARLFTEYGQLEQRRSGARQGTGLGLVLTKRIVEAQGGAVGVHSVLGKGSTFEATLPRRVSRGL